MPDPHGPIIDRYLRPIFASLQAEVELTQRPTAQPPPVLPFVTISRQAGAGGRTLARRLVERLNALDANELPWSSWDRELVEKAATEHDIPESLIESLEETRHTWFREFMDGLSFSNRHPPTDEFKVYRRVAVTIRALARLGRTVIVGRGGVFLTAGMPGGMHLRLVAPLEHRIAHMAKLMSISPGQAATQVRQIEHNRRAFYRRYWPGRKLLPEMFTLTINTAALADEEMVDCLVPLVLARYQPQRRKAVAPAS